MLEPVFSDAGRSAGVHRKPNKCEVVMVGRERWPEACAVTDCELRSISAERGALRIGDFGKYLCVSVGPGALEHSSRTLLSKWQARAAELDRRPQPCNLIIHRHRSVCCIPLRRVSRALAGVAPGE